MKIEIRQARKGDAKGIVKFRNDMTRKGFGNYTGTNRMLTAKDIKRYDAGYAKHSRDDIIMVAVDRDNGRVVGVSGFKAKSTGRTRHRGESGWMVHHDYWGRGIATMLQMAVMKEARRRGFKRVEAEAAVVNTASVRLARKLGFKIEGRRKAGLLLDNGKYADTYLFGKLLR